MELPSQQDFSNFLNSHTSELSSLFSQIVDRQNIAAVARNVPGASQNDSARKNRVNQLIDEMQNYVSQLNQTVNAIEREHMSIAQFVKSAKNEVDTMRHDMDEKRELADLRKEQASDVKHKYAADYHSSVLGLWRPLHPNTRGVLYTTSTALMLIAVAAVGYLIATRTSPVRSLPANLISSARGSGPAPASSLFNDSNNYGKVLGGAMKLRPKK